MGEGLKQMLSSSHRAAEEEEDELGETSSLSGGGESDHVADELEEDDPPSSSLLNSQQQLPPKRGGLSKYYQGKSQSFSSFSEVSCVGDLAKKETPYKRKMMMMKTCRSYAGGLDEHNNNYGVPSSGGGNSRGNGACASLIARTAGSSIFSSGHGKPPPVPIQRNN